MAGIPQPTSTGNNPRHRKARAADEPWFNWREAHRRHWMPIVEVFNFCRLAPNGLAQALEWLSRTRGVDTSELRSWDDLQAWFEMNIRFIFNPPGPTIARPMIRLKFRDNELAWRTRSGKSSGPPPPETAKPRSEAGVKPKLNSSENSPANLNPVRKNNPAEFFGTGPCAPEVSQPPLTLDDFADLDFANRISRLWQRGPNALIVFLLLFAAENMRRLPLENSLDRFLGDQK